VTGAGVDTYTFGDSDLAAERLALLAAVFEPTTEAFLRAHAPAAPALAVDLGCGPGHTTELVARSLHPARILAVEASPAFAVQAAERLRASAQVVRADVRALPESVGGAQVIFARLLLTHLADPFAAVSAWTERLAPGGVLLLEEVDSIETEDLVLAGYLDLQRAMLVGHGHTLDIGPRLDQALPATVSKVALCRPDPRDAARMFALNFASWRAEVAAAHSREDLDEIAAGLEARATGSVRAGTITWRMRQIAIRRPGGV
jgi:trans-aconitate 2-methyltransferase